MDPGVDQALESLKTVSARPGEVTGRVRLSVPTVSISLVVARLLPRFLEQVEVQAENRFVNIVAEGFDAGVRLSEAAGAPADRAGALPGRQDSGGRFPRNRLKTQVTDGHTVYASERSPRARALGPR
jgi:hypothetical protein